MPTNSRMDKAWLIHTREILYRYRMVYDHMDLSDKKKPDTKGYQLNDPMTISTKGGELI